NKESRKFSVPGFLLSLFHLFAARRRPLLVAGTEALESAELPELGLLLGRQDLVELAINFLLQLRNLLTLGFREVKRVLHERREDGAGLRWALALEAFLVAEAILAFVWPLALVAEAAPFELFALEQGFQLGAGDDAIFVGIGTFEQSVQAR